MQSVSQLFNTLAEEKADFHYRILIAGTEYTEENITEFPKIIANTFSSDDPSVGGTIAREVEFDVIPIEGIPIERKARVEIYCWYSDEISTSEEIPKGVFYISNKEKDEVKGTYHIHGYDSMVNAKSPYNIFGNQGQWPKTDIDVVRIIAKKIGVEIDSRTEYIMQTLYHYNYPVQYPGIGEQAYTNREVLGFIGAMYGGNWVITDANELLLVLFGSTNTYLYHTINVTEDTAEEFFSKDPFDMYGGVEIDLDATETSEEGGETKLIQEYKVYILTPDTSVDSRKIYYEEVIDEDETVHYEYIDQTTLNGHENPHGLHWYTLRGERVLYLKCPWGSQAMAYNIYKQIENYVYRPFEATNVIYPPTLELGDQIRMNGVTYTINSMEDRFDLIYFHDLSSPSYSETEDENSIGSETGWTERKISNAKASLAVDINKIEASVEDVDLNARSLITQLANSIQLSVEENGSFASISLTVNGKSAGRGTIMMDGNVDISGTLSAEALYAVLGDIANLTVNALSTSRRIPMYLMGDTSDDNYVYIANQSYRWVTATVRGAGSSQVIEQARDPNGYYLYWDQNVNDPDVTLDDAGYPTINGSRIFMHALSEPFSSSSQGDDDTKNDYPVWVYSYSELTKGQLSFEPDSSGVYQPFIELGAGDSTDTTKNKAKISKPATGLEVLYSVPNVAAANAGKQIGMKALSTGFLDLYGLRRITSLNFSGWNGGNFSIGLEGGQTVSGTVAFSGNNVPTSITIDGFTTTVSI